MKASLVTRLIDDAKYEAAKALGDAAAQVAEEVADAAVKAGRMSAFRNLTAVQCADVILNTNQLAKPKYKKAFIVNRVTGIKAMGLTYHDLAAFGIAVSLRPRILSKIRIAYEDGFEQ